MNHPININKCKSGIKNLDITGKIVVIAESAFKEGGFLPLEDRRFKAESGFGCRPELRGQAVFGHFICDKKEVRVSRYDIEGLAEYE